MSNEIELKRLRDRTHAWIDRNYPKTGVCQNPNCKGVLCKRTEYANLKKHKYTKDIKDYMEMCTSCHKNYDMNDKTRKNIGLGHTGKSAYWNKKPVVAIKNENIYCYDSVTQASYWLSISRTAITNCLHNRSNFAGGYKFIFK